jgi:hypothetical protein
MDLCVCMCWCDRVTMAKSSTMMRCAAVIVRPAHRRPKSEGSGARDAQGKGFRRDVIL